MRMNGVFRDITIAWRGRDYTVTPTMRLMRSIEQADISLLDIAFRTSQGRPPTSHIAHVVARLLQSAGASVSDEEVLSEILTASTPTIRALTDAALSAFMPVEPEGKNPDAPPQRKPQARAKK
jgi:hypothetical protein